MKERENPSLVISQGKENFLENDWLVTPAVWTIIGQCLNRVKSDWMNPALAKSIATAVYAVFD